MKGVRGQNGICRLESDLPIPTYGDSEILIKVHASAINRADTLQAAGQYPPPPGVTDILGLEASGEVYKIGRNCTKKFTIGDRVMCLLSGGGNSEYVAVDEKQVIFIPENLSFIQAAAIPETWLTAYQLLHFVAKISPEDTVIVHAAGSGVGTAAIQLLKLNNNKCIIATAGSQDKLDIAKELGATYCYHRKEVDWSKEVLKVTNKKGVDVILDCIGYPYVSQNTSIAGFDCRWVLYGLMGGVSEEKEKQLNMRILLGKRIQILPSTLRARSLEYKGTLVDAFTEEILPCFSKGTVFPVIDKIKFKLEQVNDAHQYMLQDTNIGKIVITVVDTETEAKM